MRKENRSFEKKEEVWSKRDFCRKYFLKQQRKKEAREGLASSEPPNQVECTLVANVVLAKGSAVVELYPVEEEALLIGGIAFLILEFLPHIFNEGVGAEAMNMKGCPSQSLDDDGEGRSLAFGGRFFCLGGWFFDLLKVPDVLRRFVEPEVIGLEGILDALGLGLAVVVFTVGVVDDYRLDRSAELGVVDVVEQMEVPDCVNRRRRRQPHFFLLAHDLEGQEALVFTHHLGRFPS